MLQTNERRGSRRRGTGSRSKIRRYTNLENVIVEETFSLSVPIDTPAAIRGEAGIKEEDENFAGDGYYISATVQNNRRYYGVLLDQAALKAASLLHFQDEHWYPSYCSWRTFILRFKSRDLDSSWK